MKILHCITLSSVGGAQTVVINLANIQVKTNEVYIISSPDRTAWTNLDKQVKIISINGLKKSVGILDFFVLASLVYYRFKIKPDVIHLHSSKMGVLGRLVFPSSKIIYTVHGFDSIRKAHRCFLLLERVLQFFCRFIVTVSQYDKDNLCHERINRNVLCIYNGVPDNNLTKGELQTRFIQFLRGIRNKYDSIIFCIARDSPQKKMDLFSQIAESNPNKAFVWIGNSTPYDNKNNLYWAGVIQNACIYLRYCDLLILPSNYEGLPMSIIEAFSFSKPVVASDVGGISELLDGKNGFAVHNLVEDFSEKINYLLSDSCMYSQSCIHARETYLASFTASRMFEAYNKIYQVIYNK